MDKGSISILGAGWLGLPLANHFVSNGFDVKLATRSRGRVESLSSLTEAKLFQFDFEESVADDFLESDILIVNIPNKNVDAFEQLFEYVEASSVKKVLFVSSTSVYKNVNRAVTEDSGDEDELHSLYQIEQLFREGDAFETTILRFAGLVGYGRHPGNWFQSRPVPQPEAPTNLIHRDDCIGIIDAIVEQCAWGEVFNGCSTTHPSKREFYCYARRLLNKGMPEFDEGSELAYKEVVNKKVITQLSYDFVRPDMMLVKEF